MVMLLIIAVYVIGVILILDQFKSSSEKLHTLVFIIGLTILMPLVIWVALDRM